MVYQSKEVYWFYFKFLMRVTADEHEVPESTIVTVWTYIKTISIPDEE